MTQYILVAEDNRDIQELIVYNLRQEGFEVATVSQGDQVLDSINKKVPDLLLLDLMLPRLTGTEVCKQIRMREDLRRLPIIMVTAKSTETDKVVGLELGADDYITKPFSPKELVARTKAVLRRSQLSGNVPTGNNPLLKCGELELDVAKHRVSLSKIDLSLTLTEFNILRELMGALGQVMSRNDLMVRAIGNDVSVTDRTIDVHMAALRKKLGNYGEFIETVRGVGYRFKTP